MLVTAFPTFASSGKTVTVTNYDDLYMAVDSAKNGDTIIIAGVIPIEWGIYLGDSSKTITLKRSGNGCIEIKNDSGEYWNIFFVNLIFDCQGVDADQFLVNKAENVDVFMEGCTFINTGTVESSDPSESTDSKDPSDPSEPTEPPATEESGQKEDEPSQDIGKVVTPPKTEESDDSGTQQAPNGTDEGTNAPSETVVNPDPSSSTEKAPQPSASESDVTVSTDTNGNTDNSSTVQNVPVTVTVDAEQPQQELDRTITVNVNGQPLTLPDCSGTVTINVQVEQPESSQAVKSESLTGDSEASQTVIQSGSGVDALEVIQTVLLAYWSAWCVLSGTGKRLLTKMNEQSEITMKVIQRLMCN